MRRLIDRNWYRYLWRDHPDAAFVLVVFVLAGLAVGGYLAMRATAGTEGSTSSLAGPTELTPAKTKQLVTTTRVTVTTAVTNAVTRLRTVTVEDPSAVARTTTVSRIHTVRQNATAIRTVTAPPLTVTRRVTRTLPAKVVTVTRTLPAKVVTVMLEHGSETGPEGKAKGARDGVKETVPTEGDQKPGKGGK